MDQDITIGMATCPQQWVGYWGYGNGTKLTELLQQILPQQEQNTWCIFSQTPLELTLSASGLPIGLPDIWVKVGEGYLTLGRQAFGRMPLYWIQLDQVIWFASRFQLLLPLVTSPTVSLGALYGYSCFSYVPTPLTPVESIVAVPAGIEQTWRVDGAGHLLSPHSHSLTKWEEKPNLIDNEQVAIAQLQTLLKEAIERQISDIGNETVGVMLSGGLDSSVVAALLVNAGVKVCGLYPQFRRQQCSRIPLRPAGCPLAPYSPHQSGCHSPADSICPNPHYTSHGFALWGWGNCSLVFAPPGG